MKMNYKKAGELSNWLFVSSVVAIGGTFFFTGWAQLALLVLGVGLIVSGIVVRVVYWRCPHCKKKLHLGFRQEPKICPYCRGTLIEEEKKEI
ncbi:MAG: hypothetical protein IIZ41_10990 [Lachnospiraceae bacterium]|jgi:hypothetical protein|nr:hypothetical protein [Lachnospiraceae bacterium]MBR3638057.1 hypothetical protein [Lachnospiraceae bacterium]